VGPLKAYQGEPTDCGDVQMVESERSSEHQVAAAGAAVGTEKHWCEERRWAVGPGLGNLAFAAEEASCPGSRIVGAERRSAVAAVAEARFAEREPVAPLHTESDYLTDIVRAELLTHKRGEFGWATTMSNVKPTASRAHRASLALLIHLRVCRLVLLVCTEIAVLTATRLLSAHVLLVEVRKHCKAVSFAAHDEGSQ